MHTIDNFQVLTPQQQLVVSLYMKSMNKTQAARDAGYGSTSVFNNPPVKDAIAEQMKIRAERLRIGADWILIELKKCYDTSVSLCDMRTALQAINLIGKHVDISAWEKDTDKNASDQLIVERLMRAKHRSAELDRQQPPVEVSAPSVSFLEPLTNELSEGGYSTGGAEFSAESEVRVTEPEPAQESEVDHAARKRVLMERLNKNS